ncbi:MAG TPA: ATP-binding protein [Vicinamibacteria bacterium]
MVRKPPPEDELSSLGVAILDAVPISLYVVDRQLKVLAWNRQREQGARGQPRRQVLGRDLRRVLPKRGLRATLPMVEKVFATGRPHEEIVDTETARLFHVRRLPVRTGGRVSHVLSWFEDITDQKALEMRVIASDRLAFLGQLVAGVAHEISNPLAGIAGCAEALYSIAQRAPGRTARRDAAEFRELIRAEVARCERIVRSLLDTARPASSRTADVGAVVGTSLRLLEHHPDFARVRVASRVAPGLPPARMEPDCLKQIVSCLAINAAQAMSGGGRLQVKAVAQKGQVIVDVQDTGPGVPAALRKEIFKPYFTTSPGRGNGLGLPIARSLARAAGGELAYRARARGGWFRLVLPADGKEGARP